MNPPVDPMGKTRAPVVGCVPGPTNLLKSDKPFPPTLHMSDELATLGIQGCYPRFHHAYYYWYERSTRGGSR